MHNSMTAWRNEKENSSGRFFDEDPCAQQHDSRGSEEECLLMCQWKLEAAGSSWKQLEAAGSWKQLEAGS